MAVLKLHHYQGYKMPFAARVLPDANAPGKTRLYFLKKRPARIAQDGSFGDYTVVVDRDGLYLIGNAQDKENGYRLRFRDARGEEQFPFVTDPRRIHEIKRRIADGELVDSIASSVALA